ncbi:MAG: nucleotidyl transferase AbiEii/AbiGii toxin family protein [Candidatus Sericytochromatia bacterium]|nr:nucleotidyl transferase AbiEii/AbiGii toxin family protein [Candidatus Sericytochromatia bacterium]
MTQRQSANFSASVRQRLKDLARQRHEDFQKTLFRFGVERLLFRLANSTYSDRFVLKGASLFAIWGQGEMHRATQDVDFLGFGDNEVAGIVTAFRGIAATPVEPDGLEFLQDSIRGKTIRAGQAYEGVTITLVASLGATVIPLQIDIGFGDAIHPGPIIENYPTLLAFPAPRVAIYPKETVVAEKFQAMVHLGIANSRMKDFFDLWTLAVNYAFEGEVLRSAFAATFERRRTLLPVSAPLALKPDFVDDSTKLAMWRTFLIRLGRRPEELPLTDVAAALTGFLMPPAMAGGGQQPFRATWQPKGPWVQDA